MKTNLKSILLSCMVLLINYRASAQYAPTYTSGYDPNYVAINSSNFSPYGTTGYSTTQKHLATLTNLALKIQNNLMSYYGDSRNFPATATISDINNTPAYKYDRIVKSNGIIARKVMYAKNHVSGQLDPYVRMVIVRPDDNLVRPCIMITNGANAHINFSLPGGYSQWALVADLALRGYSVVFYETVSPDLRTISKLIPTQYPCNYSVNSTLPNGQPTDEGRKNAYANFQYALAAYNYIITDAGLPVNQRIVNANINDINAVGISMGSLTTFMLAYSRDGVNYTTDNYKKFYKGLIAETSPPQNPPSTGACDATEIPANGFTKLCINTNPTTNINLKSIAISSSFIIGDQNYFTAQNGVLPKKVPTQFLWGNEDKTLTCPQPHDNLYFNSDCINSYMSSITFDSTRKLMKYYQIPNRLMVNCNGHHGFGRGFYLGNILPLSCNINTSTTSNLSCDPNKDYITLGNTLQTTDPAYPGYTIYLNCTNASNSNYDNQQKYTNYYMDGLAFRLFGAQMLYNYSGIGYLNTILTNFFKDVRLNTNMTWNNTPVYAKTNSDFSITPYTFFGICIPYRLSSAVTDGSIVPGASCYSSSTPYTRMGNPNLEADKELLKPDFKVYPNPSDNILNIDFLIYQDSKVNIDVFNSIGQRVSTLEKDAKIGTNSIPINTSNFPNGVYFIRTNIGGSEKVTTISISH